MKLIGDPVKPKIKILIADDHAIVRIGLSALLKTESDLSVVGVAKDGEEAVAEALRLNPDVIVMDLMMPKMIFDILLIAVSASLSASTGTINTATVAHATVLTRYFLRRLLLLFLSITVTFFISDFLS